MRRFSYKHLTFIIILAIFAAIAGCGGGQVSDKGAGTIMHIEDWKDQYPDQYNSFMRSVRNAVIKPDVKYHSHALMRQSVETFAKMPIYSDEVPFGISCLQCKSPDWNTLYAQYGDEARQLNYLDKRPGSGLGAAIRVVKRILKELLLSPTLLTLFLRSFS